MESEVAKEDSSRAATPSPKPVLKIGAGLNMMDALKEKMRKNMEEKIKGAKDAWADLEKDIDDDGATNS